MDAAVPAAVGPEKGSAPSSLDETLAAVAEIKEARQAILREIEKRIIGQRHVIDQLLIALFARGHCLFVGVPGLAKTLLISTPLCCPRVSKWASWRAPGATSRCWWI